MRLDKQYIIEKIGEPGKGATSYHSCIYPQDGGTPTRSTTFSLTVNVLDVLDPAPHFTQSTYRVEVAEGTYSMVRHDYFLCFLTYRNVII